MSDKDKLIQQQMAQNIANRGYVLEQGEIGVEAMSDEIMNNDVLADAYLGVLQTNCVLNLEVEKVVSRSGITTLVSIRDHTVALHEF